MGLEKQYYIPILQIIIIKIEAVLNDHAPVTCISSGVESLIPTNLLCGRRLHPLSHQL